MNTYCLWLGLAKETRREINAWIIRCAERYDTPVFPPHITLNCCKSAIETVVCDAARDIAERTSPFSAKFKRLRSGKKFFQCVFIELKLQSPLAGVYNLSCELLSQTATHYMPHISLIYGNFPKKSKREMIGEIVLSTKDFQINTIQVMEMGDTRLHNPLQWREVTSMLLQGVF